MKQPLLFLLLSFCLFSLPAQVTLTFTEVASGFSQPVDLVAPADGSNRLFVVDKSGTIRIINLADNSVLPGPFLDISSQVATNSERGLLSMAFHPDFASNGEFYVHYSASGEFGIPRGQTVISRFTMPDPSANSAAGAPETVLMTEPQDFSNHNGGDITFGPDGYLYIGIGDGGSGGDPNDNGQNPFNLMGTLTRIDVDTTNPGLMYGIPPGNPYADDTQSGRAEIYAIGLRNPWRFSFDRLNGDLWIGDVGQDSREEINYTPAGMGAGLNYGWDCREGSIAFPGNSSDDCDPNVTYTDPIVDFPHGGGQLSAGSITGGFVYRGEDWPELYGTYICADYAENRFFSIQSDSMGGWDVFPQNVNSVPGVTTFGESESGELYVAAIFNGRIYQVGGGVNSTRSYFNNSDFKVAVSPNPAMRQLRVDLGELTGDQLLKVQLVDLHGRAVLQQTWALNAGPQVKNIHLPQLPAGTYQLLVRSATGGKAVPVVILPQ